MESKKLLQAMKPNTHVYNTLKYLIENGSITSWDAITQFHNTRLSATIFILRNTYHLTIEATNESTNGKTYARYYLVEEQAGV